METLRRNSIHICRAGRHGQQPCHGMHLTGKRLRDGCTIHGELWDRFPVPASFFDEFQHALKADHGGDPVGAEYKALQIIQKMSR